MSAVHRDVIADVSDNVGHAKRFQMAPSRGGGQSAPYERTSIVLSRGWRQKNAIRKFGGEYECVGDANHPGCYKSISHLASSRTGVGRVRGFGFVPMLRRMCATAVVLTEC